MATPDRTGPRRACSSWRPPTGTRPSNPPTSSVPSTPTSSAASSSAPAPEVRQVHLRRHAKTAPHAATQLPERLRWISPLHWPVLMSLPAWSRRTPHRLWPVLTAAPPVAASAAPRGWIPGELRFRLLVPRSPVGFTTLAIHPGHGSTYMRMEPSILFAPK